MKWALRLAACFFPWELKDVLYEWAQEELPRDHPEQAYLVIQRALLRQPSV